MPVTATYRVSSADPVDLSPVLDHWDIDVIGTEPIASVVNQNWLIRAASGSYILRQVADWRRQDAGNFDTVLLFQFDMLTHLASLDDFPQVPVPIRSIHGTYMVSIDDQYYWLYHRIEGSARLILRTEHLQQVVEIIVRYHDIIAAYCDRVEVPALGTDPGNLSLIHSRLDAAGRRIDQNATDPIARFYTDNIDEIEQLVTTFDTRQFTQLPYLPLHRDLMPQNILWDGTDISGIIDFEGMTRKLSTMAEDLALFALFGTNSHQSGQINTAIFSLILTHYNSISSNSISKPVFHAYTRLIALEYISNYLATSNQLVEHYNINDIANRLDNLLDCARTELAY